MHAEELWTGDSLKARALRAFLIPASWLYALGWRVYLAIYRLGLKKPKSPHCPVLCIGNLLVGGTGKTPTTIHVADVLAELGHEVVISCSGYGSPASEAAALAPDGPLMASKWGDEAALIRWLRPEIPLIVGRRRVLAAEICHRELAGAVLLLDDGFQHLPLRKHLTIVLDPPQPNRYCLPAGPYREPPTNRKRADLLIPGEFHLKARENQFQSQNGKPLNLDGEVSALCALGRPQAFLEALKSKGLQLKATKVLPDHDPLSDGNLLAELPNGPIVVTGKDWVKLRERPDVEQYDIVIAGHEVSVDPADEFRNWLQASLNGIKQEADF